MRKLKDSSKSHSDELRELKHNFKKLNDEYMISKQKIDTMADSLPTTCREMVEYYFDHKIDPRF